MSIFGKILEKLGMRQPHGVPDIRPLPGHAGGGGGGGVSSTTTRPALAPAAISEVDVVAKLETMASAQPQKLNWRTSIVDLLKLLGMDSSLSARKELAVELGCPPAKMDDSAEMNMWLHAEVLKKIAQNGGNVPKELLD